MVNNVIYVLLRKSIDYTDQQNRPQYLYSTSLLVAQGSVS